jgi:hypothetical protein
MYISVRRNVVLVNDWNVEYEWLPSQTDLVSSNKVSFMKARGLVVLLAAFFSCSVLDEEFSDFSDLSSLEDLSLINVVSLSLEGDSVRLLDDASSELERGGFGLVLAFFAGGVTLFFFDADGSSLCAVEAYTETTNDASWLIVYATMFYIKVTQRPTNASASQIV